MASVESLLISIDASTESLRRELSRADKAVGAFGKNVGGGVDQIQRNLDGLARKTKVFADQVNANLRVATDFRGAERAKDIEAYGRKLDELRAKYNPVFAAQQRYEREVEEISRALKIGAINQEEYTAAIARSQAMLGGHTQIMGRAAASSGRMGNAIQQAGFQVGDFAVQVASGGGVLRPFIQQGTQLVSMFGPIGAVVGAAGAVFGALAVSLFDTGDAAANTIDALDEYNRMVATTRDLSYEAAGAIRDQAGAHRDAGVAAIESSLSAAVAQQDTLRRQIQAQQEFVRALREGPTFGDEMRQAQGDLDEMTRQFDQNSEAIDGMNSRLFILRDSIGDVTTNVKPATAAQSAHASALDRATERIEEQIVANDNAILTWGMEEELIARVEAEQRLLGAAREDDIVLSDEQAARQELLLDQYEEGERRLRSLREEKKRSEEADRALVKSAEDAARAQKKAAEEALLKYKEVVGRIRDFSEEALGDSFFDLLKGETLDFAEFIETTLLRTLANIAASAATNAIVIPIATQVVGAVPGVFGLSGQAAGGSGGGGGFSPVGAVGNHAVGRGLDAIGFDPFGQFSAGFGNLSTNFAGGGISAAMFGQAGGSAAAAGVAAVPGGMTNAATSGLFGAGGSMTAAGALGIAGIVAALGLAAYTMGLIGPNPSVGPTGVARLPNVIGRSEMELTSDNDGNPDAAEQVAKSIRDISTSAADTLGAFGRNAFGLDVGSFPQPEDGSGQPAGFNLKRIIDNVMESEDFAKGLTADEAITEGVRETLQRAFDGFDIEGVSTALENSAAKTIEELLADLDLANAIGTFAEGGRDALMELTRPLTAVEQAFREMSDAAEEGVERARELGLSVNDATAYFAELRDQLVEQTQESFDRRLRAATGNGALNIIDDMLARRGQDANSAAAAGLDVNATAGAVFDAELRQALGGASLADLGRVFGSVTDEQTRSILTTIINERALASVREAEVAGMQTLFAEHERFANAANDNARTLRNAASGLLVNRDLSPLSPIERLSETRRQFEAALGLANDNDPTDDDSQRAIQRLPSLSETLLQASRDYFASSAGYLADFSRVQDALNSTALRQESVEEQQLSALRDIENAIRDAGGSVGNLSPAQQAAMGGFNFGRRTADNQQIYNALIAAGLPTPDAFGGGQLSALRDSNPAVHAIVSALGFNSGGSFTVAGPAGNDNLLMPLRLTAGEAVNVSRGDNMAAVLEELRALRRENAEQASQIATLTAAGSIRITSAVQEGNATTKRIASTSERDSARPVAA